MSSSGSNRDAGGVGVQMTRGQLVLGCYEDQRGWKPKCSGFRRGNGNSCFVPGQAAFTILLPLDSTMEKPGVNISL